MLLCELYILLVFDAFAKLSARNLCMIEYRSKNDVNNVQVPNGKSGDVNSYDPDSHSKRFYYVLKFSRRQKGALFRFKTIEIIYSILYKTVELSDNN